MCAWWDSGLLNCSRSQACRSRLPGVADDDDDAAAADDDDDDFAAASNLEIASHRSIC